SDEQILASAFKLEKFYKKHKFKIFAIVGLIIAYFAGTAIMDKMAQDKKEAANAAFLTLQGNTTDATALEELKRNNPKLFELNSYQEAVKNTDTAKLSSLTSSTNGMIADLAKYHLAVIENKPAESKYYTDIAKIYNASILIKEGKLAEAKDELELISEESPAYNISKMIKHYGIKG
ncbi:MAG TPA: tetratricopeptide repeat protein, partial [Campylobacterales bacterium]|nr:tetratricopeptide repeat protein [Campylobacterales bacterium]